MLKTFQEKKMQESNFSPPYHADQLLNSDALSTFCHGNLRFSRTIVSLIYRFKLNAFKTKYIKNITCIFGENITNVHIVFHCKQLKSFLPELSDYSLDQILSNLQLLCKIAISLFYSPISSLL